MQRVVWLTALSLAWLGTAQAITVEELIAKNIEARGGLAALQAIKSVKTTGKLNFSGGDFSIELGFNALQERDAKLRTEASLQGLTQVSAYDGKEGWSIQPFQGRRDPERMSAEDVKGMQVEADLDGPLVNWQAKGHQVSYLGMEDVDGTEAHKIKISLKNGDTQYRYLDPDYFLEIRVVNQMTRRGIESEMETDLGNYEKVGGVYWPFSTESGPKGGRRGQKVTIEKAEVNVEIDDALFAFPAKQ
jgi:hypothetical protein